jgi:hypothetical protein
MMYLETPPRLIETTLFSAMPDKFRRKGVRTDWADANRPGVATDSFIEGPSFDGTAISTSSTFPSAASSTSRLTANGRKSSNMKAGRTD